MTTIRKKNDSFSRLFQFHPGKTFTLRELICGENSQQSDQQGEKMKSQNHVGCSIDGLEPVNHDALLSRKSATDWSCLNVGKKNFVIGAILLGLFIVAMVLWYRGPVKVYNDNLDKNGQIQQQRVFFTH